MSFRSWDNKHLAKFNSAISSEFLDFYETFVDSKLREEAAKPSSRTFAASSFRCNRRSWFRIRGTTPDVAKVQDPVLKFSADIGTACHRIIQTNLRESLKADWIDVSEYLKSILVDYEYEVMQDAESGEWQVEVIRPYPIRFACDGIIKWNGVLYLLEIKTSDFESWKELTDPKDQHIDQAKCYSSLLKIHNVLFLYQDRQFGGLKCYEIKFSDADSREVFERFEYVMKMVDMNLAPEALPKGDVWCSPNRCPYYKKCGEYGR